MFAKLLGFTIISIALFTGCHDKTLSTVDEGFDLSVDAPAYLISKPKVLFDEGHENYHKSGGTYKPFANLIKNDGTDLIISEKHISEQSLSGFNLYIIANAKGKGN